MFFFHIWTLQATLTCPTLFVEFQYFENLVILDLGELVYDEILNFILKTFPNYFLHFWKKSKLSVKRYCNKTGITFMKQTPFLPRMKLFLKQTEYIIHIMLRYYYYDTSSFLTFYFGLSSEPNWFWQNKFQIEFKNSLDFSMEI